MTMTLDEVKTKNPRWSDTKANYFLQVEEAAKPLRELAVGNRHEAVVNSQIDSAVMFLMMAWEATDGQ